MKYRGWPVCLQEMKRLLGLENELYYVAEGRVNKYAMGFVIPVPTRYHQP